MLGMGYATEALHLPGISKRYMCITLALNSFDVQCKLDGFCSLVPITSKLKTIEDACT